MNYNNFFLRFSMGVRLSEKNYKYLFNNKTNLLINTIYIIIKPNIRFSSIYKFINLLVISEKKMNNKYTYLLDDKLLSGKKTLKVASAVSLNNRNLLNNFINNFQYLYNKLMEDKLKYINSNNILERNKIFRENIKKILFLHFYHFDLDSYNYYDIISNTIYNTELFLKFNINRNYVSNCLLSACNFNFYDFNYMVESNYFILKSEEEYNSESENEDNIIVNENSIEYLLPKSFKMNLENIKNTSNMTVNVNDVDISSDEDNEDNEDNIVVNSNN
uniref:Ribosomal protein L5 n=1 Tax=Acrasis kona TaxID=1008807 RepID=A0A0B4MZE7_9EUKA|nr:ribosomal protein L5 [Acrasis kona]AID52047.1 ribosomal protein L5 [Acrasis kona]